MKQVEYIEGPEALENFEQFARAILQAPKPKIKPKKQPINGSGQIAFPLLNFEVIGQMQRKVTVGPEGTSGGMVRGTSGELTDKSLPSSYVFSDP